MTITKESVKSLFIEMYINDKKIGVGTGFVVQSIIGALLITNRHNVTGKNNITGELISSNVPDRMVIWHNIEGQLGRWRSYVEPLEYDFTPLWIEHPVLGANADFVALPLTQLDEVQLYPYDMNEEIIFDVKPSETVSVIGFPFGNNAGGRLGIWATGFLATEMDVDYDSKPIFLIDCRARPGQSGSPVIAYRTGSVRISGQLSMSTSIRSKFLGIYSGRINSESDLGIVWKVSAIKELVDSIKKR